MSRYSLKHPVLLIVLTLSLSGSYALGADVVLRKQATPGGPVIRLGDIADISATTSTTVSDLVSTPLLPAPAPGSKQFLSQAQVRDLLVSRGINIQNLRIRGAAVVQLGKASVQPIAKAQEALSIATKSQVKSTLRGAIDQYLQDQTGHAQWRIEVQIDATDYRDTASLGTEFQVQGGRPPWTGRQQFRVGPASNGEKITIQATVVKIESVLFALRAIARGDIIRVSDVEIREHEGNVPSTALSTLVQAVGMEAKQSIRANTIVQKNYIRAPLQVKRGETVTVFARSGGISVRTLAVARQEGAMGDLVQVETFEGKKRFAASVSGPRRLDVLAAGAKVKDYATLERRAQRR